LITFNSNQQFKTFIMKKFLITATYSEDGIKGLINSGGTGRKQAVERMVTGLGGSLEAFYYAFGDYDVYAIASLPDNESAAGMALAINASGMVNLTTTVLLTPEEMDKAAKMRVNYQAPGS
jgi:uncharacterized protein with GYD domain